MFVFVHYIAGVYLDFHRKDSPLANGEKKVPNSNRRFLIWYGSSGQASRSVCLWQRPVMLFQGSRTAEQQF